MNLLENYTYEKNYYILGQTIDSMDLVESWDIDSRLAGVLKSLSLSGAKNFQEKNPIMHLERALWYLERNDFYLNKTKNTMIINEIEIFDIAQDWGLSYNLTMALLHIVDSQKNHNFNHIKAAKSFIKNEINDLKEEIYKHFFKLPLHLTETYIFPKNYRIFWGLHAMVFYY